MLNPGVPVRCCVVTIAIIALTGCFSSSDGGDGSKADNGAEMESGNGNDIDNGPPDLPSGATGNGGEGDANGSAQDDVYRVTVLGNLPFLSGPPFEDHPVTTHVTDINNAGQVIGWSTSGWVLGDAHGVLWTDGNVLNIQNSQETHLDGINEQGQIVGIGGGEATPFQAFLWQDGSSMTLGELPPEPLEVWTVSGARDINSRTQVVGSAVFDGTGFSRRAFLWENGNMIDLGSLSGVQHTSVASAINDHGQVVGSSPAGVVGFSPELRGSRAFLWQNGEMIDLDIGTSEATDINNAGQIVGTRILNGEQRAFLWDDGEVVNLGTLPGADTSSAFGINEQGQVVGTSETDSGPRAFLWESGTGMRDLNDLIHRSDPNHGVFTFGEAAAINDNGQIVTTGIIDGDEHAIVLTPVE